MSIQNIAIKIYATPGSELDQDLLIPVFQDWIKTKALDDVMIDIADYRHVPNGPGMMLVCHETNYGMDLAEGNALGVLAQRKQPQEGDHQARILGVLRSTLAFVKQLAEDSRVPDGLGFELDSFEYLSNDRLYVSNTDAGFASVRDDLEAVGQHVFGTETVTLERRENHPKSRLAVRVKSDTAADLDTLIERAAA